MWQDNNDKIMEILDNIETKDKKSFPAVCPICKKREGHLYFHRNRKNDERGSMWVWCSACQHSAHTMFRVPEWWNDLDGIDIEKLTNYPDYLEENKVCIDEWINDIILI